MGDFNADTLDDGSHNFLYTDGTHTQWLDNYDITALEESQLDSYEALVGSFIHDHVAPNAGFTMGPYEDSLASVTPLQENYIARPQQPITSSASTSWDIMAMDSNVTAAEVHEHGTDQDHSMPSTPRPQNNVKRSYTCNKSPCQTVQLVDGQGWKRHLREVHGPKLHYCHLPSCKRHKQGFSRRYNLFQHQKSCHGLRVKYRAPKHSVSSLIEQSEVDTESEADNSFLNGGRDHNFEEEGLERKLRELRACKLEIESDIATIERALGIMINV